MQNQPPLHRTLRHAWLVTLVLLAACAGVPAVAPSATPPVATDTLLAPTATAPAAAPTSAALRPVPRNRTLQLGSAVDPAVSGETNPLNTNYRHDDASSLQWEGLAYYAIFANKEIPWLAQSMAYTKSDFTELTIQLNPLARWSDGQPVTAADVVFTFQAELDHPALNYHAAFEQFVQAVKAVDAHTVVLTFKIPAPRFKFEVLTLKFDTGLEIAPAHFLGNTAVVTDVTTYHGGMSLPHSGPYQLVFVDASRVVFDLRPDWWAVTAGLVPPPAVQRVMVINFGNNGLDGIASRVINNEFDSTRDLRPPVIAEILKSNPKVTTYTGQAPPYGNVDWWPNSLWVNTQLAPYNDVNVRRALSLAIDRDGLDQGVYHGAPVATIYPFPLYPGLQQFVDSPAVKALEAKYQPRRFDLTESARLMTAAGFTLNADKLWARDGQTVYAAINAFASIDSDIAPVLVQMLRRAGFDASLDYSDSVYDHMANGSPGLYLWGHGASLIDPYAAFEMFHSRHSPPPGTPVTDFALSRYSNPDYDKIVDAMAVLPADDPKFQALAAQAMEIYWRDVIDIPIIQWLHLIPYNQTYWTNWPTQANPAMGTSGAFWHQTAMLVVIGLKPVQ